MAQVPLEALAQLPASSAPPDASSVGALEVIRDGARTPVADLFSAAAEADDGNLRYMAVTYLVAGAFRGFRERHRCAAAAPCRPVCIAPIFS